MELANAVEPVQDGRIPVVLGRLARSKTWKCETCGRTTDLSADPYKAELEHDLDTANQIDAQARARGETIERLG